jgi:signal transduction histidine kinase
MVATLVVLQGPDKGKTLTASEDRVLIGRGSHHLPLSDQTISRRHAELRRQNGDWLIVDLKSANGTYVNGVRRDAPVKLNRGDQIRLGSTLLMYSGSERLAELSSPHIPRDLITLDAGSPTVDSSIMASVPSSEDSIVMAGPETARAVQAWNVMRELSDVLNSLLPPRQLLTRVMQIIFDQVDVDRGLILMRTAEGDGFHPEIVRYRHGPADSDPSRITASQTILQHVVESREGVLCSNVVTDKRFRSGESAQNIGMRSVICAPIAAREKILGVIHLDCPVTRHTYDEVELKLITAIGYQAGLALENARLVQTQLQQERLAAAGEAVAYLSHYIKNLLQGMRSGADILQQGLDREDCQRARQGWGIVDRNFDRSYNLMLNMLAFSKQREPRIEYCQINTIAEEVVELVQKQADVAEVAVLADLEDDLPPIPVDREGVHQVILNLVSNAIDAVQRGAGVITVRTGFDRAADEVIVTVTDNGPGVPPAERARIFEPFHSTKGHAGTGLGLAVARKIVREMNGRIALLSPPEGGAEFRVHLPLERPGAGTPDDTAGAGN